MCRAHATVRGFMGALVGSRGNGGDIIVDMEAGLEHLARGTGQHVSKLLTVIEPYFRSMETARRAAELARELEIADVAAVANKIRNEEDRQAITDFCIRHGLAVAAEIPYDDTLIDAERAGSTPVDFGASGAVGAIRKLTERLVRG